MAAKTSFESAELSELIEKQKWQGLKVVIFSYSLNFGIFPVSFLMANLILSIKCKNNGAESEIRSFSGATLTPQSQNVP